MQKAVDDYQSFLAGKVVTAPPCGFDPIAGLLPTAMKPFQRDITTWACKRGRSAVFARKQEGESGTEGSMSYTARGVREIAQGLREARAIISRERAEAQHQMGVLEAKLAALSKIDAAVGVAIEMVVAAPAGESQ